MAALFHKECPGFLQSLAELLSSAVTSDPNVRINENPSKMFCFPCIRVDVINTSNTTGDEDLTPPTDLPETYQPRAGPKSALWGHQSGHVSPT